MGLQYSNDVRNAKLDAIETAIGVSAKMKFRTGPKPANCGAADAGTVLATLTLPSNWMLDASGGVKVKSGAWVDLSVDVTGTAGHFRVYDNGGSSCHMQGSVGIAGTDMIVSSTSFIAGQAVAVTLFTIRDNNG